MYLFRSFLTGLFLLWHLAVNSQEISFSNEGNIQSVTQFSGFIRAGLYSGIDHEDRKKPYVSSSYSDVGLKVDLENGYNFKAYGDVRFRYGAEFKKPVNYFDLREAWIRINGTKWNLSAGQKIVKWGKTDFTNTVSKLNPQNMLSRSPDREDIDIGNLLSTFNWYPSEYINVEVVTIPFYRSSVLIIDPIPLPDNVKINQIKSLVTDKEMFSYGIRTDIHLTGIDWALSWFDGYDPMAGIALTDFRLDISGPVPIPSTELSMTPYKTRVLGVDFETTIGSYGFRGEAAWSAPYHSFEISEYVPLPEVKWIFGIDWSSGVWRIVGEYSGKHVNHFNPAAVAPLLGTEPDYALLAQMMSNPGFDLPGYIRQQVGAFNRLYNYQLRKYYHSGAFRVETELAYGRLTPSVSSIYNFSSHDFVIIPEIKYKPSDGLTIIAGCEYYRGIRGSLYDITDDFMNSLYISLRVDF